MDQLLIGGYLNISFIQATHKVLLKDFLDLMGSKGFKLVIDKPSHEQNEIINLVFLSSDYVIGNSTILGQDLCVDLSDISDHVPIKIQLLL